MSKKNGALFSKSLIGYKRNDVNEYIRTCDQAHSEEIAGMNYEIKALEIRLADADKKISELEMSLATERNSSQEKLTKLIREYDAKINALNAVQNETKDKLNESETRASSYLKIADSSSLRAEAAEAELSLISAALDESRTEIAALKEKLEEKEAEAKRISEIEALAKKMVEQNNKPDDRNDKRFFLIKMPHFLRSKRSK